MMRGFSSSSRIRKASLRLRRTASAWAVRRKRAPSEASLRQVLEPDLVVPEPAARGVGAPPISSSRARSAPLAATTRRADSMARSRSARSCGSTASIAASPSEPSTDSAVNWTSGEGSASAPAIPARASSSSRLASSSTIARRTRGSGCASSSSSSAQANGGAGAMRARHSSAAARIAGSARRRARARARGGSSDSGATRSAAVAASGSRSRIIAASRARPVLAGLQRGLGAHQRVRVVEQIAHARAHELRIGVQPHQAAQRHQTHARVGVVERERDRPERDVAAGRHQRVQARAPHVRVRMRGRAHQRRDDAARRQLGHQLEQRARRPRALLEQQLLPQHGEPRGLPAADLAVHVGQIEPARAQLRDERAQVGPPRADARAEVDERGDAAGQAQPARIRPLEHEQHDAGDRHPGVDHDALQEGPHPPAQLQRHGVVEQRAHGGRERVVEQLAVDARRDGGPEPEAQREAREAPEHQEGMDQVRGGDAEAPDQERRHRHLDRDLGQVRHRQVDTKEGREGLRRREAAREDVGVEVLREEEREHHAERGDEHPARERRAAEVAHGAPQARDRGLVRLLELEGTPAAQRPARDAQQQRRRGEQHPPGGDQRDRRQAAGGCGREQPAEHSAEARADREERHQPLARERVEVVAAEGPEVVQEDRLRQIEQADERDQGPGDAGAGQRRAGAEQQPPRRAAGR